MDYLRQHLDEGVARRRPELTAGDRQAIIDQIVEFIESYRLNSRSGPARTAVSARRDATSVHRRSEEDSTALEAGAIGFVVTCQPDGKITEVVHDGLGYGSPLEIGTEFSAIVSPFHLRKAARFLRGIHLNHPAYDCLLSVLGRSGMIRQFCSGFSVGTQIVVIATEDPLAMSIPQQLSRLVHKAPAKLGPVLEELAAWKRRQKRAHPADADSRPRAGEPGPPSETALELSTSAGRRRLLELAAHDLRNPVSGILAACQYLTEDASQALEPYQVLILSSIESSTRVALQLIQDLAEIPSIQFGKPHLELHPADLAAVIHQAISAARLLAESMKVKVHLGGKEQTATIRADAARLSEAVYGLIVDAVRASQAPGDIEITFDIRGSEASLLLKRNYTMAAGQPGSKGTRRKLSDIHAAMLLARTRRIVDAHGGALRLETRARHEYSWIMTLPAGATQTARKR